MINKLKTYQDRYTSLSSKERDLYIKSIQTDSALQAEIKTLSNHFLNLRISKCKSCYIEAHSKLMKLNASVMDKINEYALRAGTVLHDPINKDFNLLLTPQKLARVGEELALYHLAFNKNAVKSFTRLPVDIDKRLDAFIAKQDEGLVAQARETSAIRFETLSIRLKSLTEEVNRARMAYEEAQCKFDALKAQMDEVSDNIKEAFDEKPKEAEKEIALEEVKEEPKKRKSSKKKSGELQLE